MQIRMGVGCDAGEVAIRPAGLPQAAAAVVPRAMAHRTQARPQTPNTNAAADRAVVLVVAACVGGVGSAQLLLIPPIPTHTLYDGHSMRLPGCIHVGVPVGCDLQLQPTAAGVAHLHFVCRLHCGSDTSVGSHGGLRHPLRLPHSTGRVLCGEERALLDGRDPETDPSRQPEEDKGSQSVRLPPPLAPPQPSGQRVPLLHCAALPSRQLHVGQRPEQQRLRRTRARIRAPRAACGQLEKRTVGPLVFWW
mmetsp:Transcript_45566/g.128640  ORF Transcript_45566/g.128640 Transcript_45566/m.128640 type:complete len:249 (+) Transcript_45566:1119-1865(+)